MLKHTHMNIYHAQMQTSIRHSGSIIHLRKHSFNMFINRIYSCRSKIGKITYLMKTPFATSYVTAMFHPTIGQRAHQSLSNVSTPEMGMIPQGLRVDCRLTHSQGDTLSQTNTVGFTRPSTTGQASTVRRPSIAYMQ